MLVDEILVPIPLLLLPIDSHNNISTGHITGHEQYQTSTAPHIISQTPTGSYSNAVVNAVVRLATCMSHEIKFFHVEIKFLQCELI